MRKFLLTGFFLIPLLLAFCMTKGTSEEKKETEKEVHKYVGTKKCKVCHKKFYKAWKKTPHAKAFQTLIDTSAVEDTTCLPCHTTGYGEPGGFVDTTTTPKLVDVGCESCHGPGGDYKKMSVMKDTTKAIAAGLIFPPTEETCKKCHTKEHSPKFDFEKYKAKGVHKIVQEKESKSE